MFSFRTNHHRVYPKKASFEKVFIHLKINKIQNVSLAVDISIFGYKFFENDTLSPAHECKMLFAFEHWRIVFLKMVITRSRFYDPPSDGCVKLTISCKRDPVVFDSPPVTPGRESTAVGVQTVIRFTPCYV
jgi:hypothetical protein